MSSVISLVLIVFALGVFPLVALVVQVRRDYVGRRRNLSQRCYRCAAAATVLVPVTHYKGITFMYCAMCFQAQQRKSNVNNYVLLAVVAVAVIVWAFVSNA